MPSSSHDAANRQESGIELRHGDALLLLDALEDESVDAVITDPPYSSGGMHRSDRMNSTEAKYSHSKTLGNYPEFDGDSRDQRSYLAWCSLWMCRCFYALKPGRPLLSFTDWRQLPVTTDAIQAAGFVWRGIIVWDKTQGRPIPGFNAPVEYVVWGTRGPLDLGHEVYLPGLISCPVRESGGRFHRTSKPLGLMERLVEVAPPGGLVLDPFAGSSSTLVAARNRGRRALGFEVNIDHLETSGERLAQTSIGDIEVAA